ncbi:Ig-like domain-containing protein [Aquabacterium sp.]|uniref:Ig-like domain-containing protein n=1 Tax=Aquabacterium sp. TaxID=1872578 RepID=UPI002BB078B2|nr:Ig-like domain-containing protein [Aquabacterium sp.]HSW06494.1 Ig-like domain-containing protein [Aquabacterium sp.]
MSRSIRCWLPVLVLGFVAGCGGGGLDPILGTPGATAVPSVTATSPVASAPVVTGVASNARVTAAFSKVMAGNTLTPSSFTLACPAGSPVAASISYDTVTNVAMLTPATPLPASTLCVATLTTAVQDTIGLGLPANFVWGFLTAPADDVTAPTVAMTSPLAGVANVANNTLVTAVFSEDMNPASLSATSFTLINTTLGTAVPGSVSYSVGGRTAVFTPSTPATLADNSQFTATLTTGTKDLAGNALAANFVWTFATTAALDTTRPTVTLTVPAAGATAVSSNTLITATFSEDMNPATISATSFTLRNTTLGSAVPGTVSYSATSRAVIFTPSTPATLATDSQFTATVTTAATDLAGNALAANFQWGFTVGSALDAMAPTVTAVSPPDGNTAVCLSTPVTATFSEPMDPTTITTSSFIVSDNGVAVAGIVSYDAPTQRARFVPTAAAGLAANRPYVVTLTSGSAGMKDLAGNPLAVDRSWGFTTSAQACLRAIDLGLASSFGAFGGAAGVTNQGTNSVVGGNLGSTAVCSAITGFHDSATSYTETPLNQGEVNGKVYCAPSAPGNAVTLAVATQAHAAAQAAYNTLAALPPGSDPGAGQLGGLTLPGGVYTAAGGSFNITTGDLTLDAQGDDNAMWVFQSASALTVGQPALPRRVLLINGAQARNVYWQIGSAGRIEDRSVMVGTLIAPAGVTISTAGQSAQTLLTGRAISLTASVTMVNTTIVAP